MRACLARVKRVAQAFWNRRSGDGTGPAEGGAANPGGGGDDAVESTQDGGGGGGDAQGSLDMGNRASKEAREFSHIIREFITDELKYVAALDTIEELFVQPLRSAALQEKLGLRDGGGNGGGSSGDDFAYRVFANWSSIRSLHRDVAARLLETCTRRPRPAGGGSGGGGSGGGGGGGAKGGAGGATVAAPAATVAAAAAVAAATVDLDPTQAIALQSAAHRTLPQEFIAFVPFFKIYSEFLKVQGGHHDTSSHADTRKVKKNKSKKHGDGSGDGDRMPVAILEQQARRCPRFKAWLAARCADPRMQALGVEAFLAKPFQRLCRYPLYLGRLLELHAARGGGSGSNRGGRDEDRVRQAVKKLRGVIDSVDSHLHHVQAAREVAAVNRALSSRRSSGGGAGASSSSPSSAEQTDGSGGGGGGGTTGSSGASGETVNSSKRLAKTVSGPSSAAGGAGGGTAAAAAAGDGSSSIVAPNKRCLAFGELAFELVTAGYSRSWHEAKGHRVQGLLMEGSMILYRSTAKRRAGHTKVLAAAEGTEVLDEVDINPSCRVRRVRVAAPAASTAAAGAPAAGGAMAVAGATDGSGAGLSKAEATSNSELRRLQQRQQAEQADPTTTVVPRPLTPELGRFPLHLLANSRRSGVQSFLLGFDSKGEQDAWFRALDRLISPRRPPVPDKTYPKGLNKDGEGSGGGGGATAAGGGEGGGGAGRCAVS